VITLEGIDGQPRRRPVEFSEDGCPVPWCPGCLLPASTDKLLLHDCYALLVTFVTERKVCPFCPDPITTPARVIQKAEKIVHSAAVVKQKGSFPIFHSFTKKDSSFWGLRSYLPSSRTGWIELIAVVGSILTAISLVLVFIPSVPAAISWRFKKALKDPLIVSPIECPAHFVLAGERLRLTAKAGAPFENVKFHWTATAGNFINVKEQNGESEVELDTAGISVFSVPNEVSVHLIVVDEYGETVQRHERITLMPRRLANNPPVLKIPPRCNCTLQEVVAGESVSLYAMAEDEDEREALHYEWQSSSSSAQLIPITSAAGSSVILNTTGINPRSGPVPLKIYVRVIDENGGEVAGDITMMVLPRDSAGNRNESANSLPPPNRAPKLEAFMADKTTIDPGEPVRLWAFVSDADGDSPIYYDWRASAGEIQNKNETALLTTNGINTSEVIIFLTVGDGRGGRTSQKLFVKVRDSPAPAAASPSASPAQTKANE